MGTEDQTNQSQNTTTVNKDLNPAGTKNVIQVPLRNAGNDRCLTYVPAAPKNVIGNCVYYYRPYPGEVVKKTGVNFKEIADYAVKLVADPVHAREIFKKLIINETTLIPANSTDPKWSRWHNFMARHVNCGHTPPSYYISYGYYYCSNFGTYLLPRMQSQKGKDWLNDGRKLLQTYMDNGLIQNNSQTTLSTPSRRYPNKTISSVSVGVKQLELNNDTFKTFAYNSHVAAYLDAGIADVPIADLIRVFGQPNVEEWLDLETWQQAVDVAWEVVPHKVSHPIDTLGEAADAVWQGTVYVVEENVKLMQRGAGYVVRQATGLWEWVWGK